MPTHTHPDHGKIKTTYADCHHCFGTIQYCKNDDYGWAVCPDCGYEEEPEFLHALPVNNNS